MISVSHIAWEPSEESAALAALRSHGALSVEVAPGRLWEHPSTAADADVTSVRDRYAAEGFGVSGFQAILFGRPELQLFAPDGFNPLLEYLVQLCGTCSRLGGKYLVFGAPKNRRVPDGVSNEDAMATAVAFFSSVAERIASLGVTVGVEANPAEYGCNFCTHVAEVAELVRAVNSPTIRWHLDTGELAMNHEPIAETIRAHGSLIGSAHVSEPNLAAVSDQWEGHRAVAAALAETDYTGPLSIEMKRQPDGIQAVLRAVEAVRTAYGAYFAAR
jgi:sugar phosphate isomerase/epimerase